MRNSRETAAYLILTFLLAAVLPVRAAFPGQENDDVGLNIIQSVPAEFPSSAISNGIHSGKVHLVVSVDAEGRLVDQLVVAYTDEVFVAAAIRAVKSWEYEPARVRGHARASRADLILEFKADLIVTVQNAEYNSLQGIFGRLYKFQPSLLKDLDRIPVPVHVVTPTIPDGVLSKGEKRVITVEFYIDQEGKVRVPSVSREQADDRLAALAVETVEQWRFEPPMRKGRPVLVLAQQEFRFLDKPKQAAATGSSH